VNVRSTFRPVCVAEWDVLGPLPVNLVEKVREQGSCPVRLLVRMGTEPLEYANFEVGNAESLPNTVAASVSHSLRSAINERLAKSSLPLISEVRVNGLNINADQLAFVRERRQLLKNAPAISVVVCTRDRPAGLVDCLGHLDRQEYPDYEVVIVDNAPADRGAVPAALDKLSVSVPVRYVVEPRGGLAWARNAGWRAASGDIIAFTDDDAIADTHWLAEIVRGFAARPSVGCVTGMVIPAELRTEAQDWFEQFGGLTKGRGFTRQIFEPGHTQSPLFPFPPFGAGANMAFRREVLLEIDGFNVALGPGTPAKAADDAFAFTRTLLAHHTVVYQPTAVVRHFHRDTVAALAEQLHGYGTSSTAYYAALISFRPTLLLPIVRLVPAAIRYSLGSESVRTATMRNLPARFTRTEIRGMAGGVSAFVRSVMEQRKKATRHAP
jgi:O-antigen biosynthesis protein